VAIEIQRLTWSGRADGVAVKTFMPRFPHHLAMTEANGEWSVDLHIPNSARIEYRFEIRRGSRYESTLDPNNPEVATNPFGENSVLRASARPPRPRSDDAITWQRSEFRVHSRSFGGRRHHHLLAPAGSSRRDPLPLLLLHDGTDYIRHAQLDQLIGSAISAGTLPRLRVALLDPRQRNVEYSADPRHAGHVVEEVIPHLAARYVIGEQRIVAGASLGAVASWHAAWSHPGAVTGLVLQSGTFAFSRHSELPPPMANPIRSFLVEAAADARLSGVCVGQTCGRFESLIDWNRAVAAHLSRSADFHTYSEEWTGHDWGAWAESFLPALRTALCHQP
jgi:enterochelin esterase-like enzyme